MPLRFLKEGMDFSFGETEHESIYLGQVSETPTDADIGNGNTAFYAKSDGNLYKRPYGGTESGIGSSSGGSFDHTLTQTLDAQQNDINNVGTLQAAQSDSEFQTHSTEIDTDYTIPAGKGAVVSQSLSGTGSVSGDGSLSIVPETALENPLEGDIDAAGYDINNVGLLNNGGPVSDGDGMERQIWVVPAGASDPDGAAPEDIIFEEEEEAG